MPEVLFLLALMAIVVLVLSFSLFAASRIKRCPSDKILVKYGRVGGGNFSECIHGGATFVWPLIQDYAYLALTPMTISIPLKKALSLQNIRIDVPSTFTVGISTDPIVMQNAAQRLLGLESMVIEDMAREIIFGQLRLTVASLTIEQINQDRESFLTAIRKNVEPELNKIGLNLINVNITDITDESNYIDALGKKAAAEAVNQARVDVAEQEKSGAIGESQAVRDREIRVAENLAQSEKGKKKAEADQRIYVQQQESEAVIGETTAQRDKEIGVARNEAEAEKGRKQAEANQRIYVQQQESEAVQGENVAKADIAKSNAELATQEASALQRGEVARRQAEAEIQRAEYTAEQERLRATEVVREEVDKQKVEIAAAARAEKTRIEAKGEADAVLFKYMAEAEGIRKVLEGKAEGYTRLVQSCNGDAKAASTLLMIEKLEEIVKLQVEAIQNLKIDKITVWDTGSGEGKHGTSTSNFLSSMVKSLPPLQDIAGMAGVDLPEYLGTVTPEAGDTTVFSSPAPGNTMSNPMPAKAEPKAPSSGQGGATPSGTSPAGTSSSPSYEPPAMDAPTPPPQGGPLL